MHFRVSAGAKQHPNPQLISSKLLCIPFPRSAIILTAPAQKGTSGQMHLPVGCCTAAIEQHPATRFRHLDHDAKYVTLVSTPHLCSANRSIFSTGRRSEHSVQLVTRLMLLWLQKTPKVRWLARLPSSAFTAYKRHFLPRLPQNTVYFSDCRGLTMERIKGSLPVNWVHIQNTHACKVHTTF